MPVTNYLWDPETDAYLMETDGNDVTTAVYTNEPIRWGSLISQRRSGQTSYYHHDALGSTRELTDPTENVTDTNLYDAWGAIVASTGTTETYFRWFGALGYYWDVGGDDYYIRTRIYSTRFGRWASSDPLYFLEGANLYVAYFVPGSADPDGMLTIKPRGFDLAVNCKSDNHAHARWDFILDSVPDPRRKATGASCNGFLVQKVSVSCDVTACDFSKKYFTQFEYWEAWPVKRGEKTSTIKKANNYKYTDEASYNFPAGSFGWYHQRGEVRFYCAKDFGTDGWFEGGLVPYGGDGPCGTTAGLLKSTPDPPRSWSKGGAPIDEGPAFRNFEVEWCCCSCPSLRCNQASATAAPQ